MRIFLFSSMALAAALALQALHIAPHVDPGVAALDMAWHERARDQLLTAEERLDIESRRLALERRAVSGGSS